MNLLPPPGPARRRQLAALTLVVAALSAVLWYQWRPAAAPPTTSNPTAPAAPVPAAVRLPDSVKLAALTDVPEPPAVGRNPFGFGARPAPPPAETYRMPPSVMMAPPAPPVPQGPPPVPLKLMGMIVVPGTGRTMVTLKDTVTGATFQAFEGEVVDGRYRLIKVGLQSVVVSYVDGTGQRTIPLGG